MLRKEVIDIVGTLVRHGRVVVTGLAIASAMGPALSGDYAPMTRDQALAVLAGVGSDQRPNLRNRDFRGQDLSGVDFKGADLFGTHLRGVPLRDAKLARTNLDITILREADLEGADLREASIFGVAEAPWTARTSMRSRAATRLSASTARRAETRPSSTETLTYLADRA